MKKSILFVSALVLSLAFTSCSKDDDGEVGSVEGKWGFSTYTVTTSGITSPVQDYENQPGCDKDYVEFLTGGVSKEGEHNSDCTVDISTGTWVQSGNTVTISVAGEDAEEFKVVSVSNTQLKVKTTITEGSSTYTMNLTLVKE